jgi:hypothetical protein
MDITEITEYDGHTSNDDVVSFIDYWDLVDEKMIELFGVDSMDIGIDTDELANCQEDGWSALEVVEWIGEKYDLDRKG